MSRVALATSRFAVTGATGALEVNEDVDMPGLRAAIEAHGIECDVQVWDDQEVDWEVYDLIVVRSTWGYARAYEAFLVWAHARSNLVNPFALIEYSTDKHYLSDLRDQGFPVIDSDFCEVGEVPRFPAGDFVVKPAIGAGSIDALRFSPSQHVAASDHVTELHASGRCAVIQPYVHCIDERGELALIFLDGEFSHAVLKRAMLNVSPLERDGAFRASQITRAEAEPDALTLARALLTGRFADLVYARVDLVASAEGWRLMELELVEPALYLSFDVGATERLARAIARRVS